MTAREIPTLETKRLRLRPHRLGEFEAYAAMWTEPAVFRYIGGAAFTREQSWTRFLRHIGLWHHLGFGYWAIEDKATGKLGGECGFHDLHRNIEPSIEGTMEAGWGLVPRLQGQGLAEEAMRAALDWAAAHGTGDRITAIIDPGNGASRRIAEKLGFREMGEAMYGGKPLILHERPRRP
ncbi:MAG TPA: GNAT family N-acetyltransferase [Devosia sp.]|nr:GNAT family N-acetyltransferase [Devosia sp.]